MEITLKIEDHIKLIQMIADLRNRNADLLDRCHEAENRIDGINDMLSRVCDEKHTLEGQLRIKTRSAEVLYQDVRDLMREKKQLETKIALIAGLSLEDNSNERLSEEEAYHVSHGRKIQAIKCVRERLNMGLADAKRFVEDRM